MPVVYIKQTDPAGKHPDIITSHSVWDADAFLAAQTAQYTESEKVKKEDSRTITLSSEAEYRKHRNYKGY